MQQGWVTGRAWGAWLHWAYDFQSMSSTITHKHLSAVTAVLQAVLLLAFGGIGIHACSQHSMPVLLTLTVEHQTRF